MTASINYHKASPLCKMVEIVQLSVGVRTSLIMQVDVVFYFPHKEFTPTNLGVFRPLGREKAQ
jgi:hypothetical protein